ncbi:myb/SANT-like DNA-binding domain-containing protein 3 [Temnothorax americanus]|uniref:myb/SANT-like DNA-binding domain-containing protein 3 n=1 Tax=Temnothorax americanus TaxID=1964332 RepID=UPI004068664B
MNKDKSTNVHYTEHERMLLAQLISEEKVIECKKTGASDLKDKTDAWERITKKYASQSYTPRTSKQLKKCWDNMKQRKQKITTAIRHERLMTGGGLAPVQPKDPVIEFMDATNSNIDVKIDCKFDGTAVFEKEFNIKMDTMDSTKKNIDY